MSRFILWNEQDADVARNGTKPIVFNSSADAQAHLDKSPQFKEDLAQKRWTTTRVWDIITVT